MENYRLQNKAETAIGELIGEIDNLETENKKLKDRIDELTEQLEEIQNGSN